MQEVDSEKTKSNYSKTINDWVEKGVKPTWKTIKILLSSPLPDDIEFKSYKANYNLFKTKLFLSYFFSNFFDSLEEQKLVSEGFR